MSRRRLFQIGSFILAGGLLSLALYGVDLTNIWEAFLEADYRYLPPLILLILGSNLLRAWRWQILVEALPPPERNETDAMSSGRMLEASFSSVMIGYMVNYAAPRLQSIPTVWLVGGTIGLLALTLGLIAGTRWLLRRENSWLGRFWRKTLKPAVVSFNEGLGTLLHSPRRGAILVSTVGMWAGYLLMAYLPFRMLHLAEPYGIGIVDAWALMAIGALGILVPSPGGVGSYHYITEQALVHLYGVPAAEALTYAVLTHGAQLVFYTLSGGIAVLYQGTGLRPFLAFWDESPPQEESTTDPDRSPSPELDENNEAEVPDRQRGSRSMPTSE